MVRPVRLAALVFACATVLAAAPALTGIYNAAGWMPPKLTNSGIAQGSIFTVTGTGLGPSTFTQVQSFPLPTTQGLVGTTIQVTVGGVTETCVMFSTWVNLASAVLPSATPIGTGMLTLSYQGASSSIAIQVMAANFGTFTLNSAGTGPGILTDVNYVPITMIHPAHPGDYLTLWGTGLGAVSGDETNPPVQADLGTGVQVLLGTQPMTVLYGGRSIFPGEDQIDFQVPAGFTGGCKTSIAVLVKGVTGNVTTTSIAPAGQATCGDAGGFLTAANLQKTVANGSLNIGGVELSRIGGGNDTLLGVFGNFPLNTLIRSFGGDLGPSIGSCAAFEVESTSLDTALAQADPYQPTYLDAGSNLVIGGPGGTKTIAEKSTGEWGAYLAIEPSVYIQPGSYTLGNGSGGGGVGQFSNVQLTLPNSVVPTNIPSTVNRAQDLTLTWTGGSAFPEVTIFAYNGLVVTASLSSYVYIVCDANASAGTFTIPSAILNLLPANGYGTVTQPGVNLSIAGVPATNFTAPGIDAGVFSAFIANGSVATIQ
jgi:uncharacterized protein (TIGR03437 family)